MPAVPGEFWLDLVLLALTPALVLLNGFFVAAEFSLVAVRKTQVEELVGQGRRGSGTLLEQISRLDRSSSQALPQPSRR